jgi:hypothetical protein
MDALIYESLIRTAFSCGRTWKHGADADAYREMQNALSDKEDEGDLYHLGVEVGKIDAYLYDALYKIRDDERYKGNSEFITKINKCLHYLLDPTPELIDRCISEAMDALDCLEKRYIVSAH